MIDAQGRITKVRLGDLQAKDAVAADLFVIRDPRAVG